MTFLIDPANWLTFERNMKTLRAIPIEIYWKNPTFGHSHKREESLETPIDSCFFQVDFTNLPVLPIGHKI